MSLPPNIVRHIYALANNHTKSKMHVLDRSTLANKNMAAKGRNYTRGTGKFQKQYNDLPKLLKKLITYFRDRLTIPSRMRVAYEYAHASALLWLFTLSKQMYIDNMRNPDPTKVHLRGPYNPVEVTAYKAIDPVMGIETIAYIKNALTKIPYSGYWEILLKIGRSAPRGQATDLQFMDSVTMYCFEQYKIFERQVYNGVPKPNTRRAAKSLTESHWTYIDRGRQPVNREATRLARISRRAQRRA